MPDTARGIRNRRAKYKHHSPDTVFSELTDWSIVQPNGWPDYRYNDRAVMRAFADYCAGPLWAIFDAQAVQREEWKVTPPHVDAEGYFFSASTIPDLAAAEPCMTLRQQGFRSAIAVKNGE